MAKPEETLRQVFRFKRKADSNPHWLTRSKCNERGRELLDRRNKLKTLFSLSSVVTDLFPVAGGRFLDIAFKNLLGNKIFLDSITRLTKDAVRRVEEFRSFLFVADLNIGDAVIASSAVAALREIFPDAEIDFVIKKSAGCFVEGNPDVSNLFPIYEGSPIPTNDDLLRLARLAEDRKYDLVINFSPMIDRKIFGGNNVVGYEMMAAQLVRNERSPELVNNISLQSYSFVKKMFHDSMAAADGNGFRGARIYLSDDATSEAEDFLLVRDIARDRPLLLFNPDASASFTRIPFDVQRDLLRRLSSLRCTILLGSGHVERHIEDELLYSLPPDVRRGISIIPRSVNLDVYAALIDFADVYLGGDTGPLHLAAARKFSRDSGKRLRNATAVFSVFGGTPPRIYGYDSKAPGFFPANQDAPSRAFVAASPCRNITCINKMAKTCREVRCFDNLNTGKIVSEAARHLESIGLSHNRERYSIPVK